MRAAALPPEEGSCRLPFFYSFLQLSSHCAMKRLILRIRRACVVPWYIQAITEQEKASIPIRLPSVYL